MHLYIFSHLLKSCTEGDLKKKKNAENLLLFGMLSHLAYPQSSTLLTQATSIKTAASESGNIGHKHA